MNTMHPTNRAAALEPPRRAALAAAFAATFAAATLAPAAHAQDDGVATQEMADRTRQALVTSVPSDANPDRVTVVVEDGRYVLQGLVEGADRHQDAMDALAAVEGLDMSLIDDRIVRQ